jgi:hypothetical protein
MHLLAGSCLASHALFQLSTLNFKLSIQSQSYFMIGGLLPISLSWRQAPWDSRPVFFLQLNTCSHRPSAVYNCCWSSPVQPFSGPSPSRLMTAFYCLRFETPPTWRARSLYLYPPGPGWPGYTLRHWVPFLSPSMTRRAMMEVFDPASTRD